MCAPPPWWLPASIAIFGVAQKLTQAIITLLCQAKFLRFLLLPANPTVLFLSGGLSVGFLLAEQGGLPGILLAPMLLSWLFNYAYALLKHIANGANPRYSRSKC
jgi:hypothetical protein